MSRQHMINYLKKSKRLHHQMGLDIDYIHKLSDDELQWFVDFVNRYYAGTSGSKQERDDTHKRAYRAKQSDYLSSGEQWEFPQEEIQISTPEDILILLEDYKEVLEEERISQVTPNTKKRGKK